MKKSIITLLLITPLMTMADDFKEIYNNLPTAPTPAQIVDGGNSLESAIKAYDESIDAVMEHSTEINRELSSDMDKHRNTMVNRPKATKEQKQASAAITGDIMTALANAGISMEDAATMSDEQLMQILMPTVAQKTGLTEAEMRKLESMTDAQAEAYLKSHPDMVRRMQGSEYGAYSKTFTQNEDVEEMTEGDEKRLNELEKLHAEALLAETKENTLTDELIQLRDMDKNIIDNEPYEKRVSTILTELTDRYEKDGLYGGKGGPAKAPAYTKSYYDRANEVIKEQNQAIAREWCSRIEASLKQIEPTVKAMIERSHKAEELHNSMETDMGRAMSGQYIIPTLNAGLLTQYITTLKQRTDAPLVDYLEPSEYITEY